MRKLLHQVGLFLGLLIVFGACSSDDSSGGGDDVFNVKGDWKITVDDSYDSSKESFYFSTDDLGESFDFYGDVGYTKLSHHDKTLTMKMKDSEGYSVPSIEFNAPDKKATKFTYEETYKEENSEGVMTNYTLRVELERLKSPGDNPNPEPKPKSLEGIWKHSNQKYQLKIEGNKAIIYNLDEAGSQFPKKLLGDTFYDQISKTSDRTWTADSYQWKFTDDDIENGRWVNEGKVTIELSSDGNSFYQGTRTFVRVP